ncbi:hypothetical protein NKR23_g815 [Pleurostoma richardsiae]|uniref:Peptide hydrolase n=1 Tax=Pleurostoma richardsiae TaxID=41990 RepID=A0AA38RTI7_9PEZI|nr:hypothetical protein NKR23_g815 [Pleurostoma richardsiae]
MKWALKVEGKHFTDITDFSELPTFSTLEKHATVTFPTAMTQTSAVMALLPKLSKLTLQSNLQTFNDDGSGSMIILKAFQVMLTDSRIAAGQAPNTVEFHWYSAEEAGLLGSQAIFQQYAKGVRGIKAMFQQDMTGYTAGTTEAGKAASMGVITDYVDVGLTGFIKKIITVGKYCSILYVSTKCGYACSDHASASNAGYPSAFVIESASEYTSPYIHGMSDMMDTVDLDHVIEHAKMTVGFSYELAFASL